MDESEHWARLTVEHIMNNVGGRVGSSFARGVFERYDNSIKVWGDYWIHFIDEGVMASVQFEPPTGYQMKEFLEHLPQTLLDVPENHFDLVRKINSRVVRPNYESRIPGKDEVVEVSSIDLYFKERSTTSGRSTNKDRVFHAVYDLGVRPGLTSIFNLQKK